MNKTVHILNGDSTLCSLDQADIQGQRLVWRDVLCEGPVISEFAGDLFWEKRQDFMADFFGAKWDEFKTKCIDEFDKIKSVPQQYELVLWFEFDLFCQINMLGILHFLSRAVYKDKRVSLICVGSVEEKENLIGLGEIPPKNFNSLFENRISLNQEALSYASSVFLAFCDKDPQRITKVVQEHPKFPYLKGAIAAHFKRFPFKDSGLNEIEMAILNFVQEGASEPKHIVGNMLKWQKSTYYGFGDAQYFNYLKKLHPLYNEDFTLNEAGLKILAGESNAFGIIDRNYQLGGVNVADYEYDENKGGLIPS